MGFLILFRVIAACTQTYFFYHEYLELSWGNREYFESLINLADFIQYFLYLSHLIISSIIISDQSFKSETLRIANNYGEVIMTLLALVKFLQLLGTFKKF